MNSTSGRLPLKERLRPSSRTWTNSRTWVSPRLNSCLLRSFRAAALGLRRRLSFAARLVWRARGLKRLVNACHQRSLAVVLDVVYNHLGPEGII